jgi:DNA-binding NarL/FixJ family response regulator
MLRDGAYSAIFMDVWLPGGSGLDALKMFRLLHPGTPAMVLTGQFEHAHALTACALRAQYVVKPVSLAAIEAFVTQPVSFDKAMADALDEWRVRYHLSGAEADVLKHAACGDSIDAIAEARGTAISTLVTQLGSACRKTRDDSSGKMIARLLREVAGQAAACAEFPVRGRSGVFAVAAQRPSASELSKRERDVVTRLGLGHTNKEIAYDLGIADATVRTISRRANAKLGSADRHAPQEVGSKKNDTG